VVLAPPRKGARHLPPRRTQLHVLPVQPALDIADGGVGDRLANAGWLHIPYFTWSVLIILVQSSSRSKRLQTNGMSI
jgi:hypothetical protein